MAASTIRSCLVIWPLALLVVGVFELARRAIFGWED